LLWCGVLHSYASFRDAVLAYMLYESGDHLILGCAVFGSIWSLILQWLDMYLELSVHLSNHIIQFDCLECF